MYPYKIINSRRIGELIKKRRGEIGITQEQLAEKLEVSYQQIQRYENGSNRLNVENIQVIAELLSVPVSFFFEDRHPDYDSVAAETTEVLSAEEVRLFTLFKRIKSEENREIVLKVAELAVN